MKITVLPLESHLLGGNVIKLRDWDSAGEIIAAEKEIISRHTPVYIYCEVPATALSTIHQLEAAGYRFSEFRIHSTLNTDDTEIFTRHLYPYEARLIGDEEELENAIKMLQNAKQDDRYSRDPLLDPAFSAKRNIANLRKSFSNFRDEFLLGMFNSQTNEMLAFRSGGYLSKSEAHYYQYAVSPNHDFAHIAGMLEVFTIAFLKQKGVKLIHNISTGFNISELNRMITNHDFVIIANHVLLRKLIHK